MNQFLDRARATQSAIKRILLEDWDPIGISSLPDAQNEYDGYVAEVYRLLSRGATRSELIDYLWWVETEHMGLIADRQRTEKVASQLAGLSGG